MSDFVPSKKQQTAKARLLQKIKNNPLIDLESITPHMAMQLTGVASIMTWSQDAEFWVWFKDSSNLQVQVQVSAETALQRLLELIENRDLDGDGRPVVSAAAQVAAAKVLIEVAGLAPSQKREVTVTSKDLPSDEAELRRYIQDKVRSLKIGTPN